jgi:4-hydroxybenzoate polyprenyltransferase
MILGSWGVSLLFFVGVTVVFVVVDPPVVALDPPVVVALVPATLGLSTGVAVADVVDDAETVVSAVDCLEGAQPPTMSAAATKDDLAIVVIGCSAGFAR